MSPPLLKIAETFTSPQGEGRLTGRWMRFIRLAGCTVTTCPLHPANKSRVADCDTDWAYKRQESAEALADEALIEVGRDGWVCITGGEPLDQPDAFAALVDALHARGLKINVQTSGIRRVEVPIDWLTVSPKCPADQLVQRQGSELKLVYSGQSDADIRAYAEQTNFEDLFLMPLWKQGGHNVADTIDAVKRLNAAGQRWALTTQSHKWWGVR